MIGYRAQVEFDPETVLRPERSAMRRWLGWVGGTIRKIAQRSIRAREGPSPAGAPPHTHTERLPKAILYDVETDYGRVVIGPAEHLAGQVGAAHEHGGRFRDEDYDARPFMGPALEKVEPKMAAMWEKSIT